MKKLITILLCLIMLLSLFSCEMDTQESSDDNSAQSPDEKKAVEMFESAINGEIYVSDERQGDTNLNRLRLLNSGTALDESRLLKKAILDLDQDGVSEYVIKSPDNEHIILRYYNGRVYSYRLNMFVFVSFNTDGTFYWYDTTEADGWECGLGKIIFDGEALSKKSVYSLKYSADPTKYEYFVAEKAVDEKEYYDYRADIRANEKMQFSYFELSCSYKINSEKAWEIANAYWDNQDGCKDAGAGTVWTVKIELTDTPKAGNDYYRAAFNVEWSSNGGGEGDECKPPYQVKLHDQILINALTGEVVALTYDPNGKGVTVAEAIEIAKNDCDFIDLDNQENEYRAKHDEDATAPDHIYVIVIQKCVDGNYSAYAVRWVDKNTGEIVLPYYIN